MSAPRHPEDQLPLLALDLLTPEEQATLKLHLDTCLECQEHLRQFTATLAVLPLAASESQPSPSLRQRIVTAAGSTPQLASIHRKAEHRPSTSTHHRWRMLSGWIAAAALIVLTALLGLRDLTLQNEMSLLRQA
jgi:anti-sigma-K factor RskA